MNRFEFKLTDQTTLKRITKSKARKAYNNGLKIMFCPVNMNPIYPYWTTGIWIQKDKTDSLDTFEKTCNAFEYYNCNHETGYYIAFYIPVTIVDIFTGETPNADTIETIESYQYNMDNEIRKYIEKRYII